MLLKPEPIFEAVESLVDEKSHVILLTPTDARLISGLRVKQPNSHLVLVCGSYEGFDERVREHLADDELSIGDYVLTNGALGDGDHRRSDAVPASVLGDDTSAQEESFSQGLLEYPLHAASRIPRR
jgi:tRNA (guanine37-N1)-methyltransferase